MRTSRLLTALALALLGACASPGPLQPDRNLGGEDAALRTDETRYRITRTGQQLVLDVGFRYTNRAESARYAPRCGSPHPPTLEKWNGSAWVVAYASVVAACWQEPIAIAPGATYTDTLRVRAALPGSSTYPDFRVSPVAGTYRLVWRLLNGRDPNGPHTPATEVSNTFEITE